MYLIYSRVQYNGFVNNYVIFSYLQMTENGGVYNYFLL